MTCLGTKSPRRWSASWVAAGSFILFVAGSCGTAPEPVPSATSTPPASPSASASAAAVGDESPVAAQVLAPAADLPVANLCSKPIVISADGNALPLTCSNGALNVRAWKYYASISASVLGLGLNPTQGQVEAAICDDLKHNHATKQEESSGYRLAKQYYGWSFDINVDTLTCQ